MTRWEGDKGGRAPARYRSQESEASEARVLDDWADGWSATDIAIRFGDGMTRNVPIGIVNRSRGKAAEKAKRAHAVAAARRYLKGPRRVPRALPEPAQRERVVSAKALADRRANRNKPPVLTGQALAERRAHLTAAGKALVAKVALTLIANPAFVKVEKPIDLYSHMRTERGYQDAMAALTRRA